MGKSLYVDDLDYSKLKVIGILSPLAIHRLAWNLNQAFGWDMELLGDICFDNDLYFIVNVDDVLEEKWIDFSFPLHIFKEEGSKYEVNLIHNKSRQKVFVPELKQFDYLLLIDGEFDYLPEKMIDQIKRFSQVQLAVEIPVGKLKDRHILVSYK